MMAHTPLNVVVFDLHWHDVLRMEIWGFTVSVLTEAEQELLPVHQNPAPAPKTENMAKTLIKLKQKPHYKQIQTKTGLKISYF